MGPPPARAVEGAIERQRAAAEASSEAEVRARISRGYTVARWCDRSSAGGCRSAVSGRRGRGRGLEEPRVARLGESVGVLEFLRHVLARLEGRAGARDDGLGGVVDRFVIGLSH